MLIYKVSIYTHHRPLIIANKITKENLQKIVNLIPLDLNQLYTYTI